MYVEELIGPDTVNTMPLETIEAFQDHGEVRGDTVLEGVAEARAADRRSCATAGVDYDDVVETLEAEGVAEVQRRVRRDRRRHPREARGAGRLDRSKRRSSSGSGRATRPSGRERTRGAGSAGSTSRARMREDVDLLLQFAESSSTARRRRRAARHGRLVARARGDAGARSAARRSTSSTRRIREAIRALEAQIDLSRTLFISASKSGSTLETRSHTDYFWERAGRDGELFAAITDPGSELEQLAREREFRAIFAGRAEDRRPLLGALARSGWCRRR